MELKVDEGLVIQAQRETIHGLMDENLMFKALVHQQQGEIETLRAKVEEVSNGQGETQGHVD